MLADFKSIHGGLVFDATHVASLQNETSERNPLGEGFYFRSARDPIGYTRATPDVASHAAAGHLCGTLRDFGHQQTKPTEIYEDYLACVAMSETPVRRKFSRHIDIRRYLVRELIKAGFVTLIPLCTHKMVADTLTKSLPSPAFIGHRRVMMGQTLFALKFLHS